MECIIDWEEGWGKSVLATSSHSFPFCLQAEVRKLAKGCQMAWGCDQQHQYSTIREWLYEFTFAESETHIRHPSSFRVQDNLLELLVGPFKQLKTPISRRGWSSLTRRRSSTMLQRSSGRACCGSGAEISCRRGSKATNGDEMSQLPLRGCKIMIDILWSIESIVVVELDCKQNWYCMISAASKKVLLELLEGQFSILTSWCWESSGGWPGWSVLAPTALAPRATWRGILKTWMLRCVWKSSDTFFENLMLYVIYVSLRSWSTGGTKSIHPTQVIFVDNSWIRMVSKQQNADDRHATWHATCLVARKHVLHVEGWSFYRIAEVWRLPHDHSRLCGVGARETLCTVAPKPRLDRFCRWQPAGRQRYAQRDQIQLLAQRSEHGVGRHLWPAINYESHCIACCMLLVGDLTFCVNVPDCSWCIYLWYILLLQSPLLHDRVIPIHADGKSAPQIKGLPASIKNMNLEIWAPSCISQQSEATKSRRTTMMVYDSRLFHERIRWSS